MLSWRCHNECVVKYGYRAIEIAAHSRNFEIVEYLIPLTQPIEGCEQWNVEGIDALSL